MNINKYETNQKEKDISKKLPYIQKVNPIRTLYENSSQSFSSLIPKQNNLYFSPRKSQSLLKDKNISTKLYKVNDYLNMTNKAINPFSRIYDIRKSRNQKQINNLKNNRSEVQQETGSTFHHLYRNNSTGAFTMNTSKSQNNILKLNLFNNNQKKSNFNKSNTIYNDSSNNNKINNNFNNYNSNNNGAIIKKINDYNLNLLKKSRYFSKTKYINGIKNKIKNTQKHINKSLSTKNISLENTGNTTHKTFNDVVVEKLLNKHNVL